MYMIQTLTLVTSISRIVIAAIRHVFACTLRAFVDTNKKYKNKTLDRIDTIQQPLIQNGKANTL